MRVERYFESYPILKVEFIVSGFVSENYAVDQEDVQGIFERFGKLYKILINDEQKIGYAMFKSYRSAYVAFKFLDGLCLQKQNIELLVSWLKV